MELGPREIAALLPQRGPFLLVDRIVELTPDRAVGIKLVTAADPLARGHAGTGAVFPASLLIEAMAQVGGVLLAHAATSAGGSEGKGGGYLAGLDKVTFGRPVRAGDEVVIDVTAGVAVHAFARVSVTARVDGEEVAAGEISYFRA